MVSTVSTEVSKTLSPGSNPGAPAKTKGFAETLLLTVGNQAMSEGKVRKTILL